MRLIGLNGRRGSGKDQTYQYIAEFCEAQGYVCKRVAFADKLKVSAMRALGFDGPEEECVALADLIKQDEANVVTSYDQPLGTRRGLHITGRSFLQRYGTEAHRDVFGKDFWIDAVLPQPSGHPCRDNRECDNSRALGHMHPGVDILVVTDARFTNEAFRVLALGGEVWEVVRWETEPDEHASEQPLPERYITKRIDNTATLDVLYNRVAEALTT